jgi:hypothetical protein
MLDPPSFEIAASSNDVIGSSSLGFPEAIAKKDQYPLWDKKLWRLTHE